MFSRKKTEIKVLKKQDIKSLSGEKERILKSWQSLPRNYVLVHTFEGTQSPFYKHRAETLLNSWDVISTSLVDLNDIKPGSKTTPRYTGMFFTIALILEVPVQNILGTHPTDVWFPNHIGRQHNKPSGRVKDPSALSRAIFRGEGKDRRHYEGGYQKLLTPSALLSEDKKVRKNHTHNEVLVIGRPGIRIYPGLPATQNIRVRKILIAEKRKIDYDLYEFYENSPHNVAEKVAAINGLEYEII